MSMTENEIKKATFEDALYCAKAFVGVERCEECRFYTLGDVWCDDVYRIIVDALEEIQAYRAIGTVEDLQDVYELCESLEEAVKVGNALVEELKKYQSIGTIEEFKALKEKNEPKKPQEISWGATKCPICGQEFGFNSHFNHCSNCGQKLDWQ